MIGYLGSRVMQALGVVLGVVVLTFVIARVVPGDPAVSYAGPKATPEQLAAVRAEFGLDQPMWKQFITYIGGVFRGDLGTSLHTRQSVVDDLGRVIPPTLVLVTIALVLAAALGLPLGIVAARMSGRWGDLAAKIIADPHGVDAGVLAGDPASDRVLLQTGLASGRRDV